MGSRYVQNKVLDYCFHPHYIYKDGYGIMSVPCGKCDGCLLHRQNSWSMRVATEIENNPYTIFFTLTYNNKYLPKLLVNDVYDDNGNIINRFAYSNHSDNVRSNSVFDEQRQDDIVLHLNGESPFEFPITNLQRRDFINYMSKRDVQLWLKMLRRDIETYLLPNDKGNFFRYYIISEVGPTTRRCHAHGLLFCKTRQISEYLLEYSLFARWKMCDEVLFKQYCRYSDSGTASYVSNYVSSVNRLPSYYREKCIRPWRISSKSPGIGFNQFDRKEVSENVLSGNIQYDRIVKRIDQRYTLHYPKDYLASVFPKCYRYSLLSFDGLLWVYGLLYRDVVGRKVPYVFAYDRLSKDCSVSDLNAARSCFKYCREFGCTPFHYLYVLDMVYYKFDMLNLKYWYHWQELNCNNSLSIISSYCNIQDYLKDLSELTDYQRFVSQNFLDGFSIELADLNSDDFDYLNSYVINNDDYRKEVEDIILNSQKMAKYNEFSGNSPHIV